MERGGLVKAFEARQPMPQSKGYSVLPRTWKSRALLLAAFVGGIVVIFGALAMMAATDSIRVTYDNRTDQELTIMVNRKFEVIVPPNRTTDVSAYPRTWRKTVSLVALTSRGVVVWRHEYSPDDLNRLDYTIVIDN
jgi:hypothetical protein